LKSLTRPDTSKINNAGQFISVDGRPLSSSRGVGQEIVKLFKPYVRLGASQADTSKNVTDPFLCLQISCPRGTYDVNIEPAKDDLLFENRGLVLSLVETLFRDHYGELPGTEKKIDNKRNDSSSNAGASNGEFDLLMARKPPAEPALQSHQTEDSSGDAILRTPLSQRPSRSGKSTYPTVEQFSSSGTPEQSHSKMPKRSSFVNPWSISRINASLQMPQREEYQFSHSSPVNSAARSPEESRQRGSQPGSNQNSPQSPEFPSPPVSRIASGSPVRRRHQNSQEPIGSSPERPRVSSARRAERERDRKRYGNGALDTLFQRTTQVSTRQSSVEQESTQESEPDSRLSSLAQERFGLHAGRPLNHPPVDGQNDGQTEDESENEQTQQSFRHASSSTRDLIENTNESMDSGRGFPVLDRWAARLHEGVDVDATLDLEKALDFERRKKQAIQSSRNRFREHGSSSSSQLGPPISHSPHHSRYLAAKAALTSSQTSTTDHLSTTTIPSHDPRGYLIRNKGSNKPDEPLATSTKPRKLPISRLPFERIPDGYDLHDLETTCSIDLSIISDIHSQYKQDDLSFENDDEATAFSGSNVETYAPLWDQRMLHIMQQKFKKNDQSLLSILEADLSTIISAHLRDIDGD
jgi:hypothetical protein